LVEGLGDAAEPRVVSDRRTSCQATAAHGVRAGAVGAIADEARVADRLEQLGSLVREREVPVADEMREAAALAVVPGVVEAPEGEARGSERDGQQDPEGQREHGAG
jgi:hypothetical protein